MKIIFCSTSKFESRSAEKNDCYDFGRGIEWLIFLSDARIKPLHGATFVLIICERAARNINNVFFILCDDKKNALLWQKERGE